MESRIFNHKKFFVVGYHNTKKDADASAKRIRKYGYEIVHVTKDKDIYTVWAHTKKV
jgi:coenzyme F420-reducing hydrogenase alpha subunit